MFAKQLLFQSKAEYHAGKQAQTDRKYGLAVVRLDVRMNQSSLHRLIDHFI